MHGIHSTLLDLAVDIHPLTPHPENPRGHDDDALRDSLMLNGQYRPVVVQQSTNRVIAGNGTYAACLGLGWDQLAAVVVDVTDEQARRILLADNRLTELSRNDPASLLALLESLDGDLAGTGYAESDVTELLATLGKLDKPTDEDRALYSPGSDLRQLVLTYNKATFERLVGLLNGLLRNDEDTFTAVVQRTASAAVAARKGSSDG